MDYKEKIKANAKQKLKDVVRSKNLQIVKFYGDEYTERFVRAHVTDKNGKDYFLKVLVDNHELLLARRFHAEVNFYEYASKCSVSKHLNELVAYDISNQPFWYMREQLPGVAAGDFARDFGFGEHSYNVTLTKELVSFLSSKWRMGEKNKMRDSLPLARDNRIIEYMEWWYDKNRFYLGDNRVNKLLKFIRENAEAYKLSYWVLNHNDLWPSNIILGDEKMVIIDWETVGFGFPLFDVGLLLANSWGNSEWASGLSTSMLDAFADFTYEVIGVRNQYWNKVYLQVGYLYWAITLFMQADIHRGWLKLQGYGEHPKWDKLVGMLKKQIDVILSL